MVHGMVCEKPKHHYHQWPKIAPSLVSKERPTPEESNFQHIPQTEETLDPVLSDDKTGESKTTESLQLEEKVGVSYCEVGLL